MTLYSILAPKWRNWQTRTFEGRVGQPVGVRVPPSAPSSNERRAPVSGHPRCTPASAARSVSELSRDVAVARARLMRRGVLLAGLGAALALSPSIARADATYEMTLRTTDTLVGGTVELEQRVVVGVKGGRLRQEATGVRAVV